MFVLFLEEGDLTLFVVICIFSGLALSADLAIPSSIQADIIDLEFLKTGKRLTAQFLLSGVLFQKRPLQYLQG